MPDATATAHSRLCGSTVTVDLKMDGDKVTDFAHEVKACALGQASSSIMASHVIGSNADELRALREGVRKMLKENGEPPAAGKWADIAVLEPVRDYKARHASTLADVRRRGRRHRPDRGQARGKRRRRVTALQSSAPTALALPLFDASRRAPRLAGRGLIKAYRYTLSPLVGFECRHLPTCSDYADQAIERYGLWAGGWMTLARLLRCQPFGTSGLDFVPVGVARIALVYALALRALARNQRAILSNAIVICPKTGCHFSGSCSSDKSEPAPHAAARSGGAMNAGPSGVRT